MLYKKPATCAPASCWLGHRKLESTVRYLGIKADDALAMSIRVNL